MMAYFPIFIDLNGKTVLVAGGGTVAARRIAGLLDFGCRIRVIAPGLCPELQRRAEEGTVAWDRKEYETEDLTAGDTVPFFVLAAATRQVNEKIVQDCRKRNIPVNDASRKENCDFYFPGLARKGDLVAGITASGTSHTQAARLSAAVRKILEEETF